MRDVEVGSLLWVAGVSLKESQCFADRRQQETEPQEEEGGVVMETELKLLCC